MEPPSRQGPHRTTPPSPDGASPTPRTSQNSKNPRALIGMGVLLFAVGQSVGTVGMPVSFFFPTVWIFSFTTPATWSVSLAP